MSKSDFVVIHPPERNKGKCELCGKTAELRPYGPKGESICFACGMKNEPVTRKSFLGCFNGKTPTKQK